MAENILTIKQFDPVTETVGADLTHTIVDNPSNFRIRMDKDWEAEETRFIVPGLTVFMGSLNARIVYILENLIFAKGGAVIGKWERKFVTTNGGGQEIPFNSLKPNRSKFIEERVLSNFDWASVGAIDVQAYNAINKRIKSLFGSKDVFDLSGAPTFSHPTVQALKGDDESVVGANDGKIRVFPLGGATPDAFDCKLFEEDSPGSGTFTEVTGPNSGWKPIAAGAFHEYTGLAPKLYRVRVRDNSVPKVAGANETIQIDPSE